HVGMRDVTAPAVGVVAVLRRPPATRPVDGRGLDLLVRVELIRHLEVDIRLKQSVPHQLQRHTVNVGGRHVEVLPGQFDRIDQRAPTTFSMTHGLPLSTSARRVSSTRSGCSLSWSVFVRLKVWHGGDAWIASNKRPNSRANSIASPWKNANGYLGWGSMSTPLTWNPASW